MEKDRGNSTPENPDDKQDKKKKRSKKASDFGVPIVGPNEETKKTESTERTSFDDALAALVIKEPKETKKDTVEQAETESQEPEAVQAEPTEVVAADEHAPSELETPEDNADEDPETYVELPEYDPKPTEFSGGEVVINLSGDEPIAERVVLLRDDPAVAEASPGIPSEAEEASQTAQHAMQEQQVRAESTQVEAAPTVVIPEGAEPSGIPEAPVAELITEMPMVTQTQHEAHLNAAPYVSGGEQVATKQDVEDAVYYATKAGQQRGLVAGLIVGGGYEHFKHRRREKKAEKRFKKQSQQLEEARQHYNFGLQEQDRRQTEATARLNAAERRYSGIRVEAGKQPEKHTTRTPEQLAAGQPEPIELPPEHTLQQSAWHAIEIDKRTGKAVENPTFEYGEEYHKERAKESLPDDDSKQNASPNIVADMAAASQIPSASTRDTSAPADVPNATTQGPPANPTDKAKKALKSLAKSDNPVSSGPIWPWFVALAVIVVLLAILL